MKIDFPFSPVAVVAMEVQAWVQVAMTALLFLEQLRTPISWLQWKRGCVEDSLWLQQWQWCPQQFVVSVLSLRCVFYLPMVFMILMVLNPYDLQEPHDPIIPFCKNDFNCINTMMTEAISYFFYAIIYFLTMSPCLHVLMTSLKLRSDAPR